VTFSRSILCHGECGAYCPLLRRCPPSSVGMELRSTPQLTSSSSSLGHNTLMDVTNWPTRLTSTHRAPWWWFIIKDVGLAGTKEIIREILGNDQTDRLAATGQLPTTAEDRDQKQSSDSLGSTESPLAPSHETSTHG